MTARANKYRPVSLKKYLYRGTPYFTPSQLEVLYYVCQGLTNRQIAEKRFTEESAVKFLMTAILSKVRVKSRASLMIKTLAKELDPQTQVQVDQYFKERKECAQPQES